MTILFVFLSLYVYMFSNMYIYTRRETSKICICLYTYTHTCTCACRFLVHIFRVRFIDSPQFSLHKPPFCSPLWMKWVLCWTRVVHLCELCHSCAETKGSNLDFFAVGYSCKQLICTFYIVTHRNKYVAEMMVLTYNQRLKAIWTKTKIKKTCEWLPCFRHFHRTVGGKKLTLFFPSRCSIGILREIWEL